MYPPPVWFIVGAWPVLTRSPAACSSSSHDRGKRSAPSLGPIIGKLLDHSLIVGGLLGAAAGHFYNEYTKGNVEPRDAVAKPGTVFGVRMDRDVSYNASSAYVLASNTSRDAR